MELVFKYDRQLLERVPGLRKLISSRRGLLAKRAKGLPLFEHALFAPLEFQISRDATSGKAVLKGYLPEWTFHAAGATLAMKEKALGKTKPLKGKFKRYRPGDQLLGFLNNL